MNELLYEKRLDIIENGLDKLLNHLKIWRKFHSNINPSERDYVFFRDKGSEFQNNIIKLSDIINSGNFLLEIKNIFRQNGEWYFGAYSTNNKTIIYPIILYDIKNKNNVNNLRTPFIMPLIHQLKDAYIESINDY